MLRVFVVGCPRSGTTLLQSFLAAHPSLVSFPETHLLYRVRPPGGAASPRAAGDPKAELTRVAALVDHPGAPPAIDPPGSLAGTVAAFVAMADAAARRAGAAGWVEKTPANLYAIDVVERFLPDARLVHIIRDGPSVVASLQRTAPGWGGSFTPEQAVEQWLECVAITDRHRGRPGHAVVGFPSLVGDPEATLRPLLGWLGLPWCPDVVERRAEAARRLVAPDEHWKAPNTGPLRRPPVAGDAPPLPPHLAARLAATTVPELADPGPARAAAHARPGGAADR